MTTKTANISELLQQYGCGLIPFVGTENGFYERHLVFDRAIDPKVASARERFEAFSRSVRDILAQRWVLTKKMARRAGSHQSPDGAISQGYEFAHALCREVFYRRQGPGRRAKLRLRIGEQAGEAFLSA
jgi:hypothetical protein